MTPAKRRYSNWAFKSLLVGAYLLFFAIQLNSRYYSIANFYVYTGKPVSMVIRVLPTAPVGNTAPTALYRNAPQTARAHLGLDKRFHGKHVVSTLFTQFQAISYYTEIRRLFYVPAQDTVTADHPNLSLRGPPCA